MRTWLFENHHRFSYLAYYEMKNEKSRLYSWLGEWTCQVNEGLSGRRRRHAIVSSANGR